MMKTSENIDSPALGCKLGRAYQILLNQLAVALADEGLDITTSEYLVLRAAYSNPGAQQCEIAGLVGKDKAAVCRCVSGLEKKGLVVTESLSHKCLKVYPSALARELEPRIMKVAAARHRALAAMASSDDLNIFTRILDAIINSK